VLGCFENLRAGSQQWLPWLPSDDILKSQNLKNTILLLQAVSSERNSSFFLK